MIFLLDSKWNETCFSNNSGCCQRLRFQKMFHFFNFIALNPSVCNKQELFLSFRRKKGTIKIKNTPNILLTCSFKKRSHSFWCWQAILWSWGSGFPFWQGTHRNVRTVQDNVLGASAAENGRRCLWQNCSVGVCKLGDNLDLASNFTWGPDGILFHFKSLAINCGVSLFFLF